jgi:hypothetical protein
MLMQLAVCAALLLQEEARARAEAQAKAQAEQKRKQDEARAAAAEAARRKQVCANKRASHLHAGLAGLLAVLFAVVCFTSGRGHGGWCV